MYRAERHHAPGSVRAYQRRLARFEIGDYDTQLPRPVPQREPAFV